MTIERVDPPLLASEWDTLRAFLNYHRDTLRLKVYGLDRDGLSRTHPPSAMSLGGLLKHMAFVEDHWFGVVMLGKSPCAPWADVNWNDDPDWEFTTAADNSPIELSQLFDGAVAASDNVLDALVSRGGLDAPSRTQNREHGQSFSLRWIMVHMIEEYARHNGHADLIRESIDSSTGE